MSAFHEIQPTQLKENPFQMWDERWALLTVRSGEIVNTMTVSAGAFGVIWKRYLAYLFVRPQRYTFELLKESKSFSLCFFDEAYRKKLTYCGVVSGRDEDKIKHLGFELKYEDGVPFFEEAGTVFICRSIYEQDYAPECFIDPSVRDLCYHNGDYHRMFVSEILKIMSSE